MNKKLLIVSALIILLASGAIMASRMTRTSSVISPVGESESELKLTTWEDPAGFSFSYPENIEIDPHDEDQENYSHLELTSPSHEGKIIIWVKETDYSNVEDWLKKEVGNEGQVFETELGGLPAKKIAYLSPEKLVAAAIDVDALVLVEMIPDKEGFWQDVYDQILQNFEFVPIAGEATAAPAETPPANIILESEEVIE